MTLNLKSTDRSVREIEDFFKKSSSLAVFDVSRGI